jgi:uncharacterized membrane protein YphA (DoxX/SURF4 family)
MGKAAEQPSWGIVMVRVAVGGALVHAGGQMITQGAGPWLIEGSAHRIASAPRWFAIWGQEVLLRWPDFFAVVLTWSSVFLGGLLFLGALVRPVGWGIALLMVHVHFAGPAHYRELALLMALCAVACAVSRAGRRVGFDELIEHRLPTWATWVRG